MEVTLVSPNTHFYWNIAIPRAIIPGQVADEKLFLPIGAGFKQYPAGKFEFIVAYAKGVDFEAKTVVCRLGCCWISGGEGVEV